LKDKRVDASAHDQFLLNEAMKNHVKVDFLRILLNDKRVDVPPYVIMAADIGCKLNFQEILNERPRFWMEFLGNEPKCSPEGNVRNILTQKTRESSLVLLLCVERVYSQVKAARVNDVLRDVCTEWTWYTIGGKSYAVHVIYVCMCLYVRI
jgi:hypothetical protein